MATAPAPPDAAAGAAAAAAPPPAARRTSTAFGERAASPGRRQRVGFTAAEGEPGGEPAPRSGLQFGRLFGSSASLQRSGSAASGLGSVWGSFNRMLRKGSNIIARLVGEDSSDAGTVDDDADDEYGGAGGLVQAGMEERSYNLKRVKYLKPEDHTEDSYWLLKSGLPFPSSHSNPSRDLPGRWTLIKGVRDPCEDIRAPRLRLTPKELEAKHRFMEALKIRSLQESAKEDACGEEPTPVHTLNLSYQDLGDRYQFDALLTFLDMNRGIERLALTDNNIVSAREIFLPRLRALWLSRNQILSLNDIPDLPCLEELHVSYNFINNTSGLHHDKWPRLVSITLKGNPLSMHDRYERKVKYAVPKIKTLDGRVLDEKVLNFFDEDGDEEQDRLWEEQQKAASWVERKTGRVSMGTRQSAATDTDKPPPVASPGSGSL